MMLKQRSILPGFRWTLGFTIFYLCLIVLIPLSATFLKTATGTWEHFWAAISSDRVLASFKVSFICSLAAAAINLVFGMLVAWVLVRYDFPGRSLADAIIDLPFALPTAVAGIALTTLYAPKGLIGRQLQPLLQPYGIKLAYSTVGITIALVFIGIPFVVRTVQPVLQDLDLELEEAASSLGASRFQTFWRVIVPTLMPALLTGFALSFARSLGEYGSVVFISGNMPMKTEIVPLLIITKLEQNDYTGATAIAVVMLLISFALLLLINFIQARSSRHLTSNA
jgi:sulfate transport system permease protein